MLASALTVLLTQDKQPLLVGVIALEQIDRIIATSGVKGRDHLTTRFLVGAILLGDAQKVLPAARAVLRLSPFEPPGERLPIAVELSQQFLLSSQHVRSDKAFLIEKLLQARSVVEGLEADVITMNQANDIDILFERGKLIPQDWAKRLPFNSAPTTSVSVILVRKGNPKAIRDWSDLGRPGVSVIIPNPKTSGNGRYTYLAAWGAGVKGGLSPEAAKALVTRIFANVPVLDGGGRGATTTFAQRNLGDALVTFESEAPLIEKEFGGGFELIYPSRTILAENPVSVVDKVVDKRGTRKPAEAYLQFLYSDAGQEVAAKHNLRPRSDKLLAKYAKAFPKVSTFTVDEVFGGWTKAQKEHFNDGGLYDQVIATAKR